MKVCMGILFFQLIWGVLLAARPDSTRTELLLLLKERKELFDRYSASLVKKSGFFGNKTKNDLRESQEKLLSVVAIDNKIMNSLNRTLDFRNFEKLSMSYDVNAFEERLRNLSVLNDTLNSQNFYYNQENKRLQSTIKHYRLYNYALIILILITVIALLRRAILKKES